MSRTKESTKGSKRLIPVLWKKADLDVVDDAVKKIRKESNPYIDRAKFIREASIEKAAQNGVKLPR